MIYTLTTEDVEEAFDWAFNLEPEDFDFKFKPFIFSQEEPLSRLAVRLEEKLSQDGRVSIRVIDGSDKERITRSMIKLIRSKFQNIDFSELEVSREFIKFTNFYIWITG